MASIEEPSLQAPAIKSTISEEDVKNTSLCLTCRQLGLSLDKFVIPADDSTSKAKQGSRQPLVADALGTTTPLRSNSVTGSADGMSRLNLVSNNNSKKPFAMLDEVSDRKGDCRLCSALWQALSRGAPGAPLDTALFLSWEVDGRELTSSGRLVNRSRRIRVSWRESSSRLEESVFLILVASAGSSASEARFLGRARVSEDSKLALMDSWIETCISKHGKDCRKEHGTREDFMQLVEGTFFGVIDIEDMQLKPLPIVKGKPARYVALSYVWGHAGAGGILTTYTTTRSNVMKHIQKDGLKKAWDNLPETIQEAFLLVKKLGERYLWVDSLCIVQDSLSSWELNAKAMHLVYGHAHFTICAADGDAKTGLEGVKRSLRRTPKTPASPTARPPSPAPLAVGSGKQVRFAEPSDGDSTSLTVECLAGIELLVLRPPEVIIQDSAWSHRGWTFQERLLSRRCLIFAGGKVYFQCRTAVRSQDIYNDADGVRNNDDGWSLDWAHSPLRTLGELRRRAFWFYMKCVRLYTGRILTKPRDILTAFQGTSWLLSQHMNAPLLYGLPTSHFDLAMLWVPLGELRRRRPKENHCVSVPCCQDELGNCRCNVEQEGYGGQEFPSWSWCGWMGGKAEYQLDMIEGCLLNVQEWLREHTWILWYMRDHEGILRPLWDSSAITEDRSRESRWRGYRGLCPQTPPYGPHRSSSHYSDTSHYPGRGPPPQRHEASSHLRPSQPSPSFGYSNFDSAPSLGSTPMTNGVYPEGLSPGSSNISKVHKISNAPYLARLAPGFYDDDANQDEDGASVNPTQGGASRQCRVSGTSQSTPLSSSATAERSSIGASSVAYDASSSSVYKMDPSMLGNGISRSSGGFRGWCMDEDTQSGSGDSPSTRSTDISSSEFSGTATPDGVLTAKRLRRTARRRHRKGSRSHSSARSPRSSRSSSPQYCREPRPPWERERERETPVTSGYYTPLNPSLARRRSTVGRERDVYVEGIPVSRDPDEERRIADVVSHKVTATGSSTPKSKRQKDDPYGRPVRRGARRGTEFTGILPDHPFGVGIGPFDPNQTIRPMHVLQFWTWLTPLRVFIRTSSDENIKSTENSPPSPTPARPRSPSPPPKPADGDDKKDENDTYANAISSLDDRQEGPNNENSSIGTAATINNVGTPGPDTTPATRQDGTGMSPPGPPPAGEECRCDVSDPAGDWCGTISLPRSWISPLEGQLLVFIALSDARNLTAEECPLWNYYVPKEREESEWDLYYVLLLERSKDRTLWERRGLGKVFKAAFGEARWEEIKLG